MGLGYGEVFTKRCSSNVANVGNANPDNGLNVNDWNRDNGHDDVGSPRLVVSSFIRRFCFKRYFAWWTLTIHQAFCLFLEVLPVILNIFYLLLPDCLWQVVEVFLKGPV